MEQILYNMVKVAVNTNNGIDIESFIDDIVNNMEYFKGLIEKEELREIKVKLYNEFNQWN